tara:strand:+ start:38 stop:712 length:675 start_codon:yes stop_codon:yes gene_type:complete
MAGTIKLDGTTFLTKDDSNNFTFNNVTDIGTVTSGTLGSSVVVPASIGGTMFLLEKKTLSSAVANMDFDLTAYATYNQYLFLFRDMKTATDASFRASLGLSNGTFLTSAGEYRTASDKVYYDGGSTSGRNTTHSNNAIMIVSSVESTNSGACGRMYLFQPRDSLVKTFSFYDTTSYTTDNTVYRTTGGGLRTNEEDNTSVRFNYNNGNSNTSSGSIIMYGIKDA